MPHSSLPPESEIHWNHAHSASPDTACGARWGVHPDVTRLGIEFHLALGIGFEGNPGAKVQASLVAGEVAERYVLVNRITAIEVTAVVTRIYWLGKARQLAIKATPAGHVTADASAGLVVNDGIQGQRPHVNIAVWLTYIRQRVLRDISVIEAVFGQHSDSVVKHPTAAQIDGITHALPSPGIAGRHIEAAARFNRQVVGKGIVMVGVIALSVIATLVGILILHQGIKRLMIFRARAYLRESSRSQ